MSTPTIRAIIDDREVTREQLFAWEARRLPKAAKRIGLPVPSGGPAERRRALANAKLDLGGAEMRRRLHRLLRASDLVGRSTAALARGRRATSVCDLHITGGDAGGFVDWFLDDTRSDYELSMVAANPDHFLIATSGDGRQEVIETTGGSPLPAHFFVDYADSSTLTTPPDPAFPHQIAGVAQTESGTDIGGVRHQFRDTDAGFHARLTVEFPATMLPHMVSEHRWHLATEFANWIDFAFTES